MYLRVMPEAFFFPLTAPLAMIIMIDLFLVFSRLLELFGALLFSSPSSIQTSGCPFESKLFIPHNSPRLGPRISFSEINISFIVPDMAFLVASRAANLRFVWDPHPAYPSQF